MAVGVRFIYEPLHLVTGGVSGFAIVVKSVSENVTDVGIPVWITTGVVNIPLFVIGWRVKGRDFFVRSLYATTLYTILLMVLPEMNYAGDDYFLASVFGGVLSGGGLGVVYLTVSSTGGTDLAGSIIKKKIPHFSISTLIFIIDSAVVLLGAAVFGLTNAAYAIVTVFVAAKVMDIVINGPNNSKMLLIITEKEEEIAEAIFEKIGRGITAADVQGMYSRQNKKLLICAVADRETAKTVKIVNSVDEGAFVMITNSREIFGNGFVQADDYFE